MERYEPEIIWSDGDDSAPDAYWDAPANFLAWLANESPVKDTIVFNDRWGKGDICTHGQYYTCADRFLPSKLQGRKWENAFTIDKKSWGYRRNGGYTDYLSTAEVVHNVIATVALGGNALINVRSLPSFPRAGAPALLPSLSPPSLPLPKVGPSHDGTIDPIFADRLLGLGAWLGVNGGAIYSTRPWREQNETAAAAWYTASPGGAVNAIVTAWPAGGALRLAFPVTGPATTATLLGYGAVQWAPATTQGAPGVTVTLPSLGQGQAPCENAWTVVFTNVQ